MPDFINKAKPSFDIEKLGHLPLNIVKLRYNLNFCGTHPVFIGHQVSLFARFNNKILPEFLLPCYKIYFYTRTWITNLQTNLKYEV